jgi:hypothetical protein
MNVRVVIDQLVVNDMAMSPLEARRMRAALQHALVAELAARAQSRKLPTPRGAARESLRIGLGNATDGKQIGRKLGASLADHVWTGMGTGPEMRAY